MAAPALFSSREQKQEQVFSAQKLQQKSRLFRGYQDASSDKVLRFAGSYEQPKWAQHRPTQNLDDLLRKAQPVFDFLRPKYCMSHKPDDHRARHSEQHSPKYAPEAPSTRSNFVKTDATLSRDSGATFPRRYKAHRPKHAALCLTDGEHAYRFRVRSPPAQY